MKGKGVHLVEVTWTFHWPDPSGPGWQQFFLRVAKNNGQLDWSFSIPGPDGADDVLPVGLLEGISQAVAWAKGQVRDADVHEQDGDET